MGEWVRGEGLKSVEGLGCDGGVAMWGAGEVIFKGLSCGGEELIGGGVVDGAVIDDAWEDVGGVCLEVFDKVVCGVGLACAT